MRDEEGWEERCPWRRRSDNFRESADETNERWHEQEGRQGGSREKREDTVVDG